LIALFLQNWTNGNLLFLLRSILDGDDDIGDFVTFQISIYSSAAKLGEAKL